MKKLWLSVFAMLVLGAFCHFMGDGRAVEAANSAQKSCASCHVDFAAVLFKGHPAVKGKDIMSCLPCHEPDMTGKPQKNAYSARMHLAHLPPKGALDCTACHIWTPGKYFGLAGVKGSWGAPKQG